MRILKYRKRDRARAVNLKRHQDNAERVKLHVTKGDTVRVMRGDDKGKEGKIIRVYTKTGRVVIEGVNMVKRHRRARSAEEQSGIVDFPAPIHASNVMLIDPKSGDPTRARRQIDEDGTKERISVKSGDAIPKPRSAQRGVGGTSADASASYVASIGSRYASGETTCGGLCVLRRSPDA